MFLAASEGDFEMTEEIQTQEHEGRKKCEHLRMQVLASISDPELHKFVSDMPGDDQTWLFYALIASASQTKEGRAINHIRDLINSQVVAAGEVAPLVAPIEKKLAHMDEVLRDLSDSEGGHADANLRALKKIRDEFQELKDEVVENLNRMGSKQQKFVNEVNSVTAAVSGLAKTVNNLAANPQKPNYMLVGVGLIFAMFFGIMAGITASRGLSESDIRHIIQQAAVEAAAAVQAGDQATSRR